MEDLVLKYNPELKHMVGNTYVDSAGNYIEVLPEERARQKIEEINLQADEYFQSGRNADSQTLIVSEMFSLFGYFYTRRGIYNKTGRFSLSNHPGGGGKVTYEEFESAYIDTALKSLKNYNPEKGQYVALFISNLGYVINDSYTKLIQRQSNEQSSDNMEEVLYPADSSRTGQARKVTESSRVQKEWADKRFVTLSTLRTGDDEKKKKTSDSNRRLDPSRKEYGEDPLQEVIQQEETTVFFEKLCLLFAQMNLLRQNLAESNLKTNERKKATRLNVLYTGQVINYLKDKRDLTAFRNHRRDAWESLSHGFTGFVYIEPPQEFKEMIINALKTNGDIFKSSAKDNASDELKIPLVQKVYALYLNISEPQMKKYLEQYREYIKSLVE